jgi:hypothetical protein
MANTSADRVIDVTGSRDIVPVKRYSAIKSMLKEMFARMNTKVSEKTLELAGDSLVYECKKHVTWLFIAGQKAVLIKPGELLVDAAVYDALPPNMQATMRDHRSRKSASNRSRPCKTVNWTRSGISLDAWLAAILPIVTH